MGKVTPLRTLRNNVGLTTKQEDAAAYLAVGKGVAETARLVDVNRNTIYEWLKLPAFASQYKKQLRDVRREIRGKLSAMAEDATSTLEELMREGGEQAKLKAATYILDRIAEDEKIIKKAKQKKSNEKG